MQRNMPSPVCMTRASVISSLSRGLRGAVDLTASLRRLWRADWRWICCSFAPQSCCARVGKEGLRCGRGELCHLSVRQGHWLPPSSPCTPANGASYHALHCQGAFPEVRRQTFTASATWRYRSDACVHVAACKGLQKRHAASESLCSAPRCWLSTMGRMGAADARRKRKYCENEQAGMSGHGRHNGNGPSNAPGLEVFVSEFAYLLRQFKVAYQARRGELLSF
jgi:hypothetical protein